MAVTIFFSWQADRLTLVCRNLQEKALEQAIKRIGQETNLQNAMRGELVLDRDTKDEPGNPHIAETIFKKIDAATVFVPDLTFVGTRPDGRSMPNPNVLIEYGWAIKSLGNDRVVPIMNTAYNREVPLEFDLPFDLRHLRHPITYCCPEDADEEERKAAREALTKDLARAIRLVLKKCVVTTPVVQEAPDWKCIEHEKRSTTRLIRLDSANGQEERCSRLSGPNLQLSIRPRQRHSMTVSELVGRLEQLKLELPLFGGETSSRLARNEYGVCRYTVDKPIQVKSSLLGRFAGKFFAGDGEDASELSFDAFTQMYPDGEMWLVDCVALRLSESEEERLIAPDIESRFVSILDRARTTLRRLGMTEPYDVVATILGVGSRALPMMDDRGELTGRCTPKTDKIEIKRELAVEKAGDISLDCMMPLFETLWESVHSVRPDYYNVLATQRVAMDEVR